MTGAIFKSKKSLVAILLPILLVSVLAGCGNKSDSPPPGSTLIHTPGLDISEDMYFPFDNEGRLIWDANDLSSAYIEAGRGRIDNSISIVGLNTIENGNAFIALINNVQKELTKADEENLYYTEKFFSEEDLGTHKYLVSIPIDETQNILNIYESKDSGHMLFRLSRTFEVDASYYYSTYDISLNDLKKIENFILSLSEPPEEHQVAKPIIYLYPESEQDVSVKLDFDGNLTTTYPAYDEGWNIHAYPDGRLTNDADGLEYSYLYWEGIPGDQNWWDTTEGYCIPGKDTAAFLQETLAGYGLMPREYNEFIVYWLPQMQDNPYNLISFQWEGYEEIAPLEITPAPDSMLRVFMVFAPLMEPVDVKAPAIRSNFARDGFTVVEWGGSKTIF